MDLVLTAPPEGDILTLEQAKLHLRVDFDDDDDLIEDIIAAAVAMLDGHTGLLGRCLLNQTWTLRFDYCFPAWRIPIPLAPLDSVASITYVDSDGVTQTLDPSMYDVLDGPAGAIQPAFGKAWPAPRSQTRAVAIAFVAGYGTDPADVPRPLHAALKLLVGHLYANREAVVGVENRDSSTEVPLGVQALIAPYRARAAV